MQQTLVDLLAAWGPMLMFLVIVIVYARRGGMQARRDETKHCDARAHRAGAGAPQPLTRGNFPHSRARRPARVTARAAAMLRTFT